MITTPTGDECARCKQTFEFQNMVPLKGSELNTYVCTNCAETVKSKKPSKDALGDDMKNLEGVESDRRFMPLLPVVARLDGRCFSKFTRGFNRPYDERMSTAMTETTRFLVEETDSLVGFTQSDEITLAWHSKEPKSQIWFDGRIMKMNSVLAAMASVKFNELIHEAIPETKNSAPVFDCRVWTMPTPEEAARVFLWRELDATKNAISMAASEYYSHKELHGKTGSEKQEMLFQKGINFNDYPEFFKRGTYIRRIDFLRKFSLDELLNLPEKHEARKNPDMEYIRKATVIGSPYPFRKISNKADFLFNGAVAIKFK